MGWFNKEYIYKNKVFDVELKNIYRVLISNREKTDYSVSEIPDKEQAEKGLNDAVFFVATVKEYILGRIEK